jgi:hypothetical protein
MLEGWGIVDTGIYVDDELKRVWKKSGWKRMVFPVWLNYNQSSELEDGLDKDESCEWIVVDGWRRLGLDLVEWIRDDCGIDGVDYMDGWWNNRINRLGVEDKWRTVEVEE